MTEQQSSLTQIPETSTVDSEQSTMNSAQLNETLNELQTENDLVKQQLKKRGFKICHLNLCSVRNKFHEICKHLTENPHEFAAFTESKLDKSDPTNIYEMDNYNLVRRDSGNSNSGGILAYIKKGIKFSIIEPEITIPGKTEVVVIRLSFKNMQPIVIVSIYNHPTTNKQEFIHYTRELLQFISVINHDTYVIGDLNFNLLKTTQFNSSEVDRECEQLQRVFTDFGFYQKITTPTRITATSITLLDPMYTNNNKLCNTANTLRITTSDHLMTYIVRDTKVKYGPAAVINYLNFNKVDFNQILKENYSQRAIESSKSVEPERFHLEIMNELNKAKINTSLTKTEYYLKVFEDHVNSLIEKYVPRVKMRIRNRIPEWLDDKLKNEIVKRDTARNTEENLILNKDQIDLRHAKKTRTQQTNKVNHLLADQQNNYFLEKFRQVSDSLSIWKLCDKLVGTKRNQKMSNEETELKILGKTVSDKVTIANHFAETILLKSEDTTDISTERIQNVGVTDKLKCLASRSDFRHAFQSMRKKHQTTPIYKITDGLYSVLSLQLLSLLNLIIFNASIPKPLKTGSIIPIYKGHGPRSDSNNYRPITILPFISKLLEKLIYYKLQAEVRDQLDRHQHGFRNGFSCDTAWNSFTERALKMLDKKNGIVAVAFVDLKKAFDTVEHVKLIRKIKPNFSINPWIVNILIDYLGDRYIQIKLHQFMSTPYEYKRGCPQGASLSSLLFIMFLNDLKDVFIDVLYILFADDLLMFVGGVSAQEVEEKLNEAMSSLQRWLKDNNMVLNVNKTKVMVIQKPQDRRVHTIKITYNNETLEQVQEFKYLGITVDNKLGHKIHAENVDKKINTNIKTIHRIKRRISKNVLSLLINTYINSVVDFGLTTWSTVGHNSIQHIQERIDNLISVYFYPKLATLYNKSFWSEKTAHASKIRTKLLNERRKLDIYKYLDDLNLPTLNERVQYFTILRAFKILKFNSGNLAENFDISTLSGRKSSITLRTPRSKLMIYNKSFFYRAANEWNKMPPDIRKLSHSTDDFKIMIAKWILSIRNV